MLKIRHERGPLAGKDERFGAGVERVAFGRDPAACDVVFPPNLTIVARRHFALVRKPSGDWTIDLFGEPYVELDGRPAESGEPVRSGATIALGGKHGPAFTVSIESDGLAPGLPGTEPQLRPEGWRAATARTRRFAFAGLSLAVIAAAGVAALTYFSQREGARIGDAVAQLAKAQSEAAAQSIGAGAREKLLQSVYLVFTRTAGGNEYAGGTAFGVGPNLLGTNAHVAIAFERLKQDERLFVRAPGPNGKVHEIIEARLHPGWKAFETFLAQDPLFVAFSKECADCFSMLKSSNSYDVALLRTADGDTIGSMLDIAPQSDLETIKQGLAVAMGGYPSERISGAEVLPIAATPTLVLGMIQAASDMFMLPAEPAKARVLRHNMPITGGLSGSPIIAPSGKVVAVLHLGNADNVPNVGRVWSSALVHYAQRVDDLVDLMAGRADDVLARDRVYWAQQMNTFRRGYDVIVPWILARLRPAEGARPVRRGEEKAALGASDVVTTKGEDGKEAKFRQRRHRVFLRAGQTGAFIGYAQRGARIRVYLMADEKTIAAKDDGESAWFPHFTYKAEKDGPVDIYVIGNPDADVRYTLLNYGWEGPQS